MGNQETVVVDRGAVWAAVEVLRKRAESDRKAVTGLESLAYVFADTEIGDEIASIWCETRDKGAR